MLGRRKKALGLCADRPFAAGSSSPTDPAMKMQDRRINHQVVSKRATTDGILIRYVRLKDRKAVRDLTLRAYEEYASLMPSRHWVYYRENIIETLDGDETADRILAESDGVIVGSVMLYPAGRLLSSEDDEVFIASWPEVRLLAVDPEARGRGIGAALMRECAQRARRAGSEFLVLHTNDLMRAAIHLYEKLGFERFPEADWVVDEKTIVKAYRLDLSRRRQADRER
jgi:ribosomal protein S18 acetylase RimI-like enzyme